MDSIIDNIPKKLGRPKLRGCSYIETTTETGKVRRKCSLTKKTNAVDEPCQMSDKGRCSLKKVSKVKKPSFKGCMVKMGKRGETCVRNKDSDEVDERCMKNEKGRCSIKKAPRVKKVSLNGCMIKMGKRGESCIRNKDSDEIDERCMKNEKGRCAIKKAPKEPKVAAAVKIVSPSPSIALHLQQALEYDFAIATKTNPAKNMGGMDVSLPSATAAHLIRRLSKLMEYIETHIKEHIASVSMMFPASEMGKIIENRLNDPSTMERLSHMSIATVKTYLERKLGVQISEDEANLYRVSLFTFGIEIINLAISAPLMSKTRSAITPEDVDKAIVNDEEYMRFVM
jgi:hypothetical protein